jgi:hypothetical protein
VKARACVLHRDPAVYAGEIAPPLQFFNLARPKRGGKAVICVAPFLERGL